MRQSEARECLKQLVETFNSLFEMPHVAHLPGSVRRGAFNSLFEMRDSTSKGHDAYLEVDFQFSI